MTPPAPRPRHRRKDAVLWSSAAVLALGGVTVGGLLRPAASAASSDATQGLYGDLGSTIAPPKPGAPSADRLDARADDRVAAFLLRQSALRSLEGVIARAFGPAPQPTPPSSAHAVRSVRVARGATSQACLAQAVYYEARGEPTEGQAAVAQVVLNRTHSGVHPADVCGVVFEGAARAGCQFSFACDGRLGGRRPDPTAWRRAQTVAAAALSGPGRPELAGALNYHADYVRPRWAAGLARTAEIGRHIFYAAARPAAQALGWSVPAPPPPATAGA